ncbi:DUF2155 domain-containing protein [Phaeobacter sp. CNT1-3]|jgi:hypothetical protein|nr:DUF2155 domain-containing protein [Phaeobacter sp. CNT1-3]
MIRAAVVFSLSALIGTAVSAQDYVSADGAMMRGLDKVNGETQDLDIATGGSAIFGDLRVRLGGCRYPADNPSGEAFAFVTIEKVPSQEQVFEGWMMASAPALNALDHPRYDVWALRCKTPAAE